MAAAAKSPFDGAHDGREAEQRAGGREPDRVEDGASRSAIAAATSAVESGSV